MTNVRPDPFETALRDLLAGRVHHRCSHPCGSSPFLEVRRHGLSVPARGWKLHVSSDLRASPELVRTVLPIVLDARAHLKVIASSGGLGTLSHGGMGVDQIGKILTIYPEDDHAFSSLAEAIDRAWNPMRFPRVATDHQLRPGSAVFAREGDLDPRGTSFDQPGRGDRPEGDGLGIPPRVAGAGEWLPPRDGIDSKGTMGIDGKWFARIALLRHSAKGALHFGMDDALTSVMIKTARVGACEDAAGFDAADRLRREAGFLEAAGQAGVACPKVVAFSAGPIPALALRDCTGGHLAGLDRLDALTSVLSAIENVASLHRTGIVHRDLTPTNILRGSRGVTLIDFELAALSGEAPPFGGSPLFAAPEANDGPAASGQDVYALGAITGSTVLAAHGMGSMVSREEMLGRLHRLSERRVAAAVSRAMEPDPGLRCDLDGLAEAIGSAISAGAPTHP